jgi:hypothetical protein
MNDRNTNFNLEMAKIAYEKAHDEYHHWVIQHRDAYEAMNLAYSNWMESVKQLNIAEQVFSTLAVLPDT